MNKLFAKEKKKIVVNPKVYAWIIGFGLTLFSVHNKHLTVTGDTGTIMFLPWIGFALILMSAFLLFNKEDFKWNYGSRLISIPLLIIVACIVISTVVNPEKAAVASSLFAITLFLVYLLAASLGKDILTAFIPVVIIQAASCIILGIVNPGIRNGGFITHSGNFDIGSGLLVFGTLAGVFKGQWWLSAIAITGLFFTGAEEGMFSMTILTIALIVRKDWSKKLLLPVGALSLTLIICTPLGITQSLYLPASTKISAATSVPITPTQERIEVADEALNNRIDGYKMALSNFKWFGHGYNLMNFYREIPHNVPLIILYQIGIFGALAWLWVTGYCLFKTKWKYAFIGVLAMSTFDHYLWTQVAPWWWVLTGVAATSKIEGDYIFKK
jgi:hypothetical protein